MEISVNHVFKCKIQTKCPRCLANLGIRRFDFPSDCDELSFYDVSCPRCKVRGAGDSIAEAYKEFLRNLYITSKGENS